MKIRTHACTQAHTKGEGGGGGEYLVLHGQVATHQGRVGLLEGRVHENRVMADIRAHLLAQSHQGAPILQGRLATWIGPSVSAKEHSAEKAREEKRETTMVVATRTQCHQRGSDELKLQQRYVIELLLGRVAKQRAPQAAK